MSVPHALATFPGFGPPPAAGPPGWTRRTLLRTATWHVFLDVFAGNEPVEMPADPGRPLSCRSGAVLASRRPPASAVPGRDTGCAVRRGSPIAFILKRGPAPPVRGMTTSLGNACPYCDGMGTVAVQTVLLVITRHRAY